MPPVAGVHRRRPCQGAHGCRRRPPAHSRSQRDAPDHPQEVFGTENQRLLKRLQPRVAQINALEPDVQALSDDALRARTVDFRERVARGSRSTIC